MIDEAKLKLLIQNYDLQPIVQKLNDLNVNWAIGGSACLYLFGNERMPHDIDILLPNNEHNIVDTGFNIKSEYYRSSIETVRNSRRPNNENVQFTSNLNFDIDERKYDLSLNKMEISHIYTLRFGRIIVRVMSPEYVILVKALLQRGEKEGKHDVEDIRKFMDIYPQFDKIYFLELVQALNAKDRVSLVLDF